MLNCSHKCATTECRLSGVFAPTVEVPSRRSYQPRRTTLIETVLPMPSFSIFAGTRRSFHSKVIHLGRAQNSGCHCDGYRLVWQQNRRWVRCCHTQQCRAKNVFGRQPASDKRTEREVAYQFAVRRHLSRQHSTHEHKQTRSLHRLGLYKKWFASCFGVPTSCRVSVELEPPVPPCLVRRDNKISDCPAASDTETTANPRCHLACWFRI